MKKNKGFTLIELLAVIIILAVIALIATPTILNVIDNARRKAFEETARGYYNAARYTYDEMYLDGTTQDLNFTFENGQQVSSNSNYKLEVSGEIPNGGLVYLSKGGQILVSIHNNKYCANVSNEGKVSLSENIEDCSMEITSIPSECFNIYSARISTPYSELLKNEEWVKENYNLVAYNFDNANCPKSASTLIIPDEINGIKVEGFAYRAFWKNDQQKLLVNHLIIPSEVKVLDMYAFYDVGLKSVILPDHLIYLGFGSFGNNELTDINIPMGVQGIDRGAFSLNRLTSITIPGSVKSIENLAFSGNQLTNVFIEDGVIELAHGVFQNNQLTNVIIPDSVINIGSNAFQNNQLVSAMISNNAVSIGRSAFENNQLVSIEIPDSVTSIEQNAFRNNLLTNVSISNNIKIINSETFKNNQLKNIEIPDGVTNIEQGAFQNNQLISVTIPTSITKIGNSVFENNQLINIEIPSSVTSIGVGTFNNNQLPRDQAFIYKRNSDGSEDRSIIIGYGGANRYNVVIPDEVQSIDVLAFSSNQLESITIPNSVNSIGTAAFSNNQIKEVTIGNGMREVNNIYGGEIEKLTIGQDVGGNITVNSFANCKIKELVLGPSVTNIVTGAFNNNQLPEDQAFIYGRNSDGTSNTTLVSYGGINTNRIVIPEGVEIIEGWSFLDFIGTLTEITFPSSLRVIREGAFNGVTFTNLVIPEGVETIEGEAFSWAYTLETLQLPNTLKHIGYNAFAGNLITELTIPASVETIEEYAFGDGQYTNITIEGNSTRFDSIWESIGFPPK